MTSKEALQTKSFETKPSFAAWLDANHASSPGIWLKFAKKSSGVATISTQEALEIALCYGWIDGKLDTYDDLYFIVRYTPRRAKSVWSKRNKAIAERLDAEGRMKASGRRQIEAAKAEGRWEQAYDSPKNMKIPSDFLNELAKDPVAEAFFKTLNKANTYAIAWRLQTAKKPETRARRMNNILAMLARREKFH